METEFDLVRPGTGAAHLESILETFVWEGDFHDTPAISFVDSCLLRSGVGICLVTAATELDIAWDGIARILPSILLAHSSFQRILWAFLNSALWTLSS